MLLLILAATASPTPLDTAYDNANSAWLQCAIKNGAPLVASGNTPNDIAAAALAPCHKERHDVFLAARAKLRPMVGSDALADQYAEGTMVQVAISIRDQVSSLIAATNRQAIEQTFPKNK